MDIGQERQKLKATLARIQDQAVKAELERRFEEIAARHAAASEEEKPAVEAEIKALQEEASKAASGPGGGAGGGDGSGGTADSFLTLGGFWMVMFVIALIFGFLFYYFWALDGDFTSPASIRPLLVLTLIVAMLGFGGLLMIRALFAPYAKEEIQERFRLGREVFLVFSGIFGTIIGFYFGAEDEVAGGAPTVEIAFAEGRVTAAVSEGTAPFLGIFTPRDQTGGRVMDADDRVLSLAIEGGTCPDGATIAVVDSRGRRADGTVDCDEGDEGDEGDAETNDAEPNPAEPAVNEFNRQ